MAFDSAGEVDFGFIANFGKTIGASEDALRLLISLLAGQFVVRIYLTNVHLRLMKYFCLCWDLFQVFVNLSEQEINVKLHDSQA